MALSDFQRFKLNRMFEVYDVDGDGCIEEEDFTRRAHLFAEERGWADDSAEFREHFAFTLADWQNLRGATDADGDGRVTRAEFLAFAEAMLGDAAALEQYAYQDADLIFRAMDADADDRITANEYKMFLRVYHIDPDHANYFFARLDRDSDGFVSREEIRQALQEYLFSDDLEAPGNYLYGPLSETLERVTA